MIGRTKPGARPGPPVVPALMSPKGKGKGFAMRYGNSMWDLSGRSGTGIDGTMCTPSVEFRGRFIRHPTVHGMTFPTSDEAFRYMQERLGHAPHFKRPFLFISLRLPRAARRALRAMDDGRRWECLVRMALPIGRHYIVKMRDASYMAERRAAWWRYLDTGRSED